MTRRFPRHILLPQEHGAWMLFLSPLVIGLVLGGRWNLDTVVFTLTALAAFLLRQPMTIWVKVLVGRRPRRDGPIALRGMLAYGAVAGAGFLWLLWRGHGYLLYLVPIGAAVLAWYLYLVAQRRERHQRTLDLVASGMLALAAPAAIWIARGHYLARDWLLWALLWLQAATSIVYIFVRLEQREWPEVPPWAERLRRGWRALLYSTTVALAVYLLGRAGWAPPRLWWAYALQWGEVLWGVLVAPAVGRRPTYIGIRQLIVYTLFTLLFLWASLQAPQFFQ